MSFRMLLVGLIFSGLYIKKQDWSKAWFASSVYIFFASIFGVVGMYPGLLLSSIDPDFSKTIHNSASSPLTLWIMLVVVIIFVPIVIIYQIWAYRIFKGKVGGEHSGYHGGI